MRSSHVRALPAPRRPLAVGTPLYCAGDSLLGNTVAATSAGISLFAAAYGAPYWTAALDGRFGFANFFDLIRGSIRNFTNGANRAVGGTDTFDFMPQINDIINAGGTKGYIWVCIGTNELGDTDSEVPSDWWNRLRAGLDAALTAGFRIMLMPIPCRSDDAGTYPATAIAAGNAKWVSWADYNARVQRWAVANGNRGVVLVRVNQFLQDPNDAQIGAIRSDSTRDGLHWSNTGAYNVSRAMTLALPRAIAAGSAFETSQSVTGNYWPGSDLAGAASNFSGTGVSGTNGVATNLKVIRLTGSAGTAVCSKVAGTPNKQRVTFTTDGTGGTQQYFIRSWNGADQYIARNAAIQDTDYVTYYARREISDPTLLIGLYSQFLAYNVSSVQQFECRMFNTLSTTADRYPAGVALDLKGPPTEPMPMSAAITKFATLHVVTVNNAVAGSFTLDISEPSIRVVPNPNIKYGAAASYEAESSALFARFSGTPTALRKSDINTLIRSLKNAGVWTKLDALYVLANLDANAASKNWIADNYNLTATNAPTFTTDRGYTFDGSTNYLANAFNPTSSNGLFTLNDACMGAQIRSVTNSNFAMGNTTSRLTRATATVSWAGNAAAEVDGTASGAGFVGWSRLNSSSYDRYIDTTTKVNQVTASTALTNAPFDIGRAQLSYFAGQISAAFFGKGLTQLEMNAAASAIATYMTSVGA